MKDAMISEIVRGNKLDNTIEVRAYSNAEKEKIIAFMESIDPFAVAGKVFDCVKQEELEKENVIYRHNGYLWNTQDIYHLDKYNAAVSEEFFEMAMLND